MAVPTMSIKAESALTKLCQHTVMSSLKKKKKKLNVDQDTTCSFRFKLELNSNGSKTEWTVSHNINVAMS